MNYAPIHSVSRDKRRALRPTTGVLMALGPTVYVIGTSETGDKY